MGGLGLGGLGGGIGAVGGGRGTGVGGGIDGRAAPKPALADVSFAVTATAGRSADAIAERLQRQRHRFRHCHRRAQGKVPWQGTVDLVVTPDGAVAEVQIVGPDAAMKTCLQPLLASFQLAGGKAGTVSFTVDLQP